MRKAIIITTLAAYSVLATGYAIPEVKRELAEWGFNEHLKEAEAIKADAERAKHANAMSDALIAAGMVN